MWASAWPARSRSLCTRPARATIVLVGLLAWAGYAVFPASFAAGFAFITAVVVFLLNAISPDTLATAWARLVDTLVGGGLGLLAYALWPTWSAAPARQALADLISAAREYLAAVLAVLVTGGRPEEDQIRTLSRRARLARTTAEAQVARSLSEPATRRIDAEESQGMLAAMRRLIQAGHVLRLDAQEDDPAAGPQPGLAPLMDDLDTVLSSIESALRVRPADEVARAGVSDSPICAPVTWPSRGRPRMRSTARGCSPNWTRSSTRPTAWPRWRDWGVPKRPRSPTPG